MDDKLEAVGEAAGDAAEASEATEAVEAVADDMDQAASEDEASAADEVPAQRDDEAPEEPADTSEAFAESGSPEQAASKTAVAEQEQSSKGEQAPEKLAKATGIGDLVAVGILAIILGVLLALPSALGILKSDESASSAGSSSVAVVVNGTAIAESELSDYVMKFRSQQGLESDDDWGEWLVSSGYTVERLRSDTVEYFTNRELLRQAIAEQGIEVQESEVDDYIANIVEQVGGQDAFEEALESEGLEMEGYRDEIRFSLQQQALAKAVVPDAGEVTDEEILEIAKMYFPDSVKKDAKSLDGVDKDTVEQVRSMLASSKMQQAFDTWMQEFREKASVEIMDAPENLPYAIDLAPYEAAAKMQGDYADDAEGEDVEVEGDADDEDADDDAEVEIVDVEEDGSEDAE